MHKFIIIFLVLLIVGCSQTDVQESPQPTYSGCGVTVDSVSPESTSFFILTTNCGGCDV